MASCISASANLGFKVRSIVTDNHAANVNAIKALQTVFSAESDLLSSQTQTMRKHQTGFAIVGALQWRVSDQQETEPSRSRPSFVVGTTRPPDWTPLLML